MIENGVLLYPEADTFEETAGTLLSHLICNSKGDASSAARAYCSAICSLGELLVMRINSRPDCPPGSVERQIRNRTISVIKRMSHNFRKRSHKEIRIWKG